MRIVSGLYKGRRLNPKKLDFTRPTTDFAREGLFNVLSNLLDWNGMEILDLYAGSGAMSIEFISRGASSVTSVDIDTQSVKFIASVKNEWNIPGLEVIKSDAIRYLERCAYSFDLIFADPPYTLKHHETIVETVIRRGLLKDNGMLIVEHDKNVDLSNLQGFSNKRTFGKVNFSIFSKI